MRGRLVRTTIIAALAALWVGVPATARRAAAQAPAIGILSSSSYHDSIGALHVVGEAVNNTDQPVQFVRISAAYYDAAGAILDTDFTYTELDVLDPGQASPFQLITLDPPAGIDSYKLTTGSDSAYDVPLRDLAATVGSVRVDAIGTLNIVGEVANNTGVDADFVKVAGALYDDSGRVIRVDFTYTDRDTIAAGGASPFKLLFLDAPAYSTYKLWVQGRPAQ